MFRQPFLLVGRRPDSDLVIDHWQVSRRHAYIQLIDGEYFCVDLGSRTGTIGGDVSERSGWLEEGRALQIGPYAVRLEWPGRASRSAAALPASPGSCREGARPGALADGPEPRPRRPVADLPDPDRRAGRLEVPLQPGPDPPGRLGGRPPGPEGPARQRRADPLRQARGRRRASGRPPFDPAPLRHPAAAARRQERAGAGDLRWSVPDDPTRAARRPDRRPPRAEVFRPTVPAWPIPPSQQFPALIENSGALADPGVSMMFQQFGMMQQQMFDQFHQTMLMMFEGLPPSTASRPRRSATSSTRSASSARRSRIFGPRPPGSPMRRPGPTSGPGPSQRFRAGPRAGTEAGDRPAPLRPDQETRLAAARPGGRHPRPALPPPDTMQNERQNRWQKILGMMSSKD